MRTRTGLTGAADRRREGLKSGGIERCGGVCCRAQSNKADWSNTIIKVQLVSLNDKDHCFTRGLMLISKGWAPGLVLVYLI